MANTPKELRKWVKDEKQLIKLLYQKGFLVGDLSPERIYWNAFKRTGKKYRYGKHKFSSYYPELHYCTVDYWGEADEHSVVDAVIDNFYWTNGTYDEETCVYAPTSKILSREALMKHLKNLPTVIKDSKINTVLKQSNN